MKIDSSQMKKLLEIPGNVWGLNMKLRTLSNFNIPSYKIK